MTATVVDEFGAPVAGADVAATVGGATRSDATDDVGVATVGNLATGSASVDISLDTFQTQTVTATIQADQTTSVNVELIRNTQAAGGVFTTNVIGTPSENGKVLTIELQVVVVDQRSHPIDTLTAGDFALPDCTPSNPDTNPSAAECVRFTEDAQADHAYTVENPSAAAFALVPGAAPADYAATLMLDQSGSILETDPTNARLFSAKAFMETVDAASGDSVLLTAFASAAPTALIPTTPLWYAGTFTSDGPSYFDALDALGTQAEGGTPLYRGLYPEATDPANESGFTTGLIDYVEANAPAGLRKAIVIFTDGEDKECTSIKTCRAKRGRAPACRPTRCSGRCVPTPTARS